MKTINTQKGALIAIAAAGLFAAGCATTGSNTTSSGSDAKVECHGVNACKGMGACGGAGHSCAGMNECKGHGWLKLTEAECEAKGGKVN